MSRFISIFLSIILVTGCSNPVSELSKPLKVEKIAFDSKDEHAIKQIVFEFNQDIAVLGAVPLQNQIDAITISSNLERYCNWRFINLNKLSCELQKELKFLTQYIININQSFSALGKQLTNATQRIVETGLPVFTVDYEVGYRSFPQKINIGRVPFSDFAIDTFSKHLKLKLPDGTYENLLVKKASRYQQKVLSITPSKTTENFPEGNYKLVLTKGFKAYGSQITLREEAVIDDFWFAKRFRFYGFACIQGMYQSADWIRDIKLESNLYLNCKPENLAISLSVPVELGKGYHSVHSVEWLHGRDYTIDRVFEHKGKVYHPLVLSGESLYELDLSKVKSIANESLDNSSKITFKTNPASPLWYFDGSFGTVVESDNDLLPIFLRRNVDEIYLDTQVIESAEDLQNFLNERLNSSVRSSLLAGPKTIYSLNEQPVDFRKHLKTSSGMAYVNLSGVSSEVSEDQKEILKSHAYMFQSVDYNVAVWNGKDLVVQTMDWQASPISKASVLLICENSLKPIELGDTDVNGIVKISVVDWARHSSLSKSNECWIWTQAEEQFAAIKLPSYRDSVNNDVNAFAWTAQPIYQPNDTVHIGFIARTRGVSGLVPLRELSNYELLLKYPNGEGEHSLVYSELSTYGFSDARYELPSNAALGEYQIVIKNQNSGVAQRIASFLVGEFTTPEFEFSVDVPAHASFGGTVQVEINANRMNGEALKNAGANISLSIKRAYSEPKSWPKEFEFNSWADFNKNTNGKESFKSEDVQLNKMGRHSYTSENLNSTVPYGALQVITEVVSDDGETQLKQQKVLYFSREHYIGTKFDAQNKQLKVIAIDRDGNELDNVSAHIKVLSKEDTTKDHLIFECKLKQLPGSCDVSDVNEPVSLDIESGEQKYKWYRSHNFDREVAKNPLEYKEKFEFSEPPENKLVGDIIALNLHSSVAGNGSFILQAGEVQKVWHQDIVEGDNTVRLNIEPSWIPYARIFASLPVDRYLARELTSSKILNMEVSSDVPPTPARFEDLFDSQRLLTTEVTIKVLPAQSRPTVEISINDTAVQAGSEVAITINSNVDADSQIWLVNDALLNLMRKSEDDFDYYQKVMSKYSFEGSLTFDALSRHLVLDSIIAGGVNGLPQEVATRVRIPPPPAQGEFALNFASVSFENFFADINSKKTDFASSLWVGTKRLIAGEVNTIKLKLPQLIGRWKVLALTATAQTMSIDSATLKTIRDVEYFFDVPTSILSEDTAEFAVTQINRVPTPVQDELTLWIDEEEKLKIEVQLRGKGYKRTSIKLPQLRPGKHVLKITSKNQPQFAALSILNVESSSELVEKIWLQPANTNTEVMMPDSGIEDSLHVLTKKAGQIAPDWNSLIDTNRVYPHQCWEQTISRAVAYQFNPLSESSWTKGTSELKRLISKGQQHFGYTGFYSFFPNMNPDPFLTAYSYFVSALLENTTTPIGLSKEQLKDTMFYFLEDEELTQYLNVTSQAKSMALLALAYNKQVNLPQALKIRQSLGKADNQSSLLQALALRYLGADKSVYESTLSELNGINYIDNFVNIFSQNSDKCLATMIYDSASQNRESLLEELVSFQQQNGSFGSTYADAICSFALKDMRIESAGYEESDFKIHNKIVNYQIDNGEAHWLKMIYAQQLDDINESAIGIAVTRKLFVQRNEEWKLIDDKTSLKLGELVKTTLTVSSPTNREHIAITDSVAGGLEAINPEISNQRYQDTLGRNWMDNTRIEIRNGKTYWYLRNLNKGEHDISYYSRARYSGEFGIAPARVEAMYRSDVTANTQATRIIVKR